MKKALVFLILIIPVLACANEGYEKIEALNSKTKKTILFNAVLAYGFTCDKVATVVTQGEDTRGDGYWTAHCAGGERYSVRVSQKSNGGIAVTACEDVPENQLACADDTESLAAE